MLSLDLQFFAKDGPGGEKTEDATPKKLDKAREEGQVAKSKEIANATSLFALFLLIKFYAASMGRSLITIFGNIYGKIDQATVYQGDGQILVNIRNVIAQAIYQMAMIVLPIFLLGCVLAFLSDLVQVKWKPTSKPLKPKFNKLNPINGIKRLFSLQSLMELLKSILKIGLIGYVAYSYLKGESNKILILYELTLMQGIGLMADIIVSLGIRISAAYLVIAILDFIYQKVKFKNDMKMTKQEVKDEMKDQEGDPQVKGKIRSKMREASQRRMMADVPKADVVITNPTHFAVALKYDPSEKDAPYLLAKGEDYLAQKIKEIARENQIEIVENKPLARAIYHNVDVGATIPPELYQAVAEVLTQVYKAQGKI